MPAVVTNDEWPLRVARRILPDWLTREGAVVDEDIREGKFQRSLAAITAISALLSGWEVTSEHYRGSFGQRLMYSPVLISTGLALAGIGGVLSRRLARTIMPLLSVLMLADGVVGFIWHIRGIHRKPGGWRIPIFNIVMGPPLFAPLLLGISGYLGVIASLLRREEAPTNPLLAELSGDRHPGWLGLLPGGLKRLGLEFEHEAREGLLQQHLAAAAAVSVFFSGGEALYSHYKNNFKYWYEWTPISVAPVLMAAGIGAVFSRAIARTFLPVASLLALLDGMAGTFFHVRGILRRPAGVNPRPGGINLAIHNMLYGPPPMAPMLLSASGFLGLLASLLRRSKP